METTHRPIVVKESKTPITALCSVEKEIWCATEGIISIWDASKKLLKKEFNAHHSVINQLLKIHQKGEFFSSSTLTVWSSSADGTVKIWDTKEHNNYSLIKTVSSDSESASCLCLVAHKYVWCGFQSKILICDLSGNSICTISVTNCFNLRIITSEQHVWCSIDNDIWIFRSDTHKNSKPLRVLSEQANSIQCFLFLKNYIWVGDSQGDITIWSCETFEKVASVKSAHNGSIFSLITIKSERKDHEVWSSGQDCLLRIWDSENYICVNALTSPDDYIKAMVVHLESGYLWTGSTTLCVWDETKTTNSDRLLTYTNGDKYVGQIATESPTERNGKGELHCQSGEIYVGYWLKDKRHGYGICTYCNKDKYYGFWREDQRWGHGVYVFNDGTCYDGMWKAGKKKGLGNLFMPNGDYIEGEWYEDEIIKGKFVKGSLDIVPTCSQNLFGACIEKLSLKEQKFTIIPFYKWNFFLPLQKKNIERLLQSSFPNNAITIKDLTVLLNDSTHPLGQAISDFNYMFNASYHYSYGEVKTLLSNAIDDIHSFIRMVNTISELVPYIKRDDCNNVVNKILFSKIYNSLYSLFRESNKNKDALLSVKIHSLSGITLKTIGVDPKFWLQGDNDESNLPYSNVMAKLAQITEMKTISKKLRCLVEASNMILRCVDEYYKPELRMDRPAEEISSSNNNIQREENEEDNDGFFSIMGAEDKFPILLFCLIKNNIPNLHSELQFIKEFADSTIAREESSYRLTELEQAVHYIESLDWNVYDKDGILISVSILEKNLLEAMKSSRKIFFNIRNEFPRMLWLAEILLMIGTKREHKYQDYELDYVKYTDDKQYWDIAEFVFSSVGLTLFKSNSKTFLHFEHQYPQYLYTRLSTLIEQEIKRLI